MTKYAGLSMTLSIDNTGGTPVAITNDVGTVDLDVPVGELDVTGLDKPAIERLQLLQDVNLTIGGNGLPDAATRAVIFEAQGTTRTVAIGFPNSADAGFEAFLFGYKISRGQDGGINWTCNLKLNNGTALAWT